MPHPKTKLPALSRLLFDLLPSEERWLLGRVFVAVLATAVFETLGVASILPFMSIVVDPSAPLAQKIRALQLRACALP